MKITVILLILNITFIIGYSQILIINKPDYELIKTKIKDSSSIYYYPKLLNRLKQNDSTLTMEDFRYLYYGYTFQPDYKPYRISQDEMKLLKYYKSEKINKNDYPEIIELANHSLTECPFDLRQMNYLAYIYNLKGDKINEKKIRFKLNNLFNVILSSGDGKTCETGYYVISINHEYVILNLFQLHNKSQALTGDCDRLSVIDDSNNGHDIFFNIKRLKDSCKENMNK